MYVHRGFIQCVMQVDMSKYKCTHKSAKCKVHTQKIFYTHCGNIRTLFVECLGLVDKQRGPFGIKYSSGLLLVNTLVRILQ